MGSFYQPLGQNKDTPKNVSFQWKKLTCLFYKCFFVDHFAIMHWKIPLLILLLTAIFSIVCLGNEILPSRQKSIFQIRKKNWNKNSRMFKQYQNSCLKLQFFISAWIVYGYLYSFRVLNWYNWVCLFTRLYKNLL